MSKPVEAWAIKNLDSELLIETISEESDYKAWNKGFCDASGTIQLSSIKKLEAQGYRAVRVTITETKEARSE